jgi:actin-related protein
MFHSGEDDIGAIIADFGSYSIKIGFAGGDSPSLNLSNV